MLTAEECRVVADRAAQCRVEWAGSLIAGQHAPYIRDAVDLLAERAELVDDGEPAIALAALRGDLTVGGISRAAYAICDAYGTAQDYYADLAGAPQRVVTFFRDQAERPG